MRGMENVIFAFGLMQKHSIFLKAEELKGKLCGLYSEKEKTSTNVNIMGKVMIDGKALEIKVGEDCAQEEEND